MQSAQRLQMQRIPLLETAVAQQTGQALAVHQRPGLAATSDSSVQIQSILAAQTSAGTPSEGPLTLSVQL